MTSSLGNFGADRLHVYIPNLHSFPPRSVDSSNNTNHNKFLRLPQGRKTDQSKAKMPARVICCIDCGFLYNEVGNESHSSDCPQGWPTATLAITPSANVPPVNIRVFRATDSNFYCPVAGCRFRERNANTFKRHCEIISVPGGHPHPEPIILKSEIKVADKSQIYDYKPTALPTSSFFSRFTTPISPQPASESTTTQSTAAKLRPAAPLSTLNPQSAATPPADRPVKKEALPTPIKEEASTVPASSVGVTPNSASIPPPLARADVLLPQKKVSAPFVRSKYRNTVARVSPAPDDDLNTSNGSSTTPAPATRPTEPARPADTPVHRDAEPTSQRKTVTPPPSTKATNASPPPSTEAVNAPDTPAVEPAVPSADKAHQVETAVLATQQQPESSNKRKAPGSTAIEAMKESLLAQYRKQVHAEMMRTMVNPDALPDLEESAKRMENFKAWFENGMRMLEETEKRD
ncbi:hypothetical protein BJ508DRAFT_366733 [Ascobolus immersus RN42]|uniref:Uncharacterized protein n=1 Tax=Ascobolus immersus RN42 TaxID=1160509 RepID=A0A3N4HKP1_ASCIM|nr:hypothetical protein BJ508DRAFT_366733 [Ascobolus immersus RN42]